jgi:hypothetical protein
MVVALLALFVALASSGFAAVKLSRNSVKSKNIAPNAVKSSDIARNAVKSSDIAPNAVRSSDIAPDNVTGADVLESTLAKVPDADTLDGNDASTFPKVFSGSSALDPPGNPDQAVMFSVPQLGVSALADNTIATSGALRIRNDRSSGTVAVSDRDQFDGVSFLLAPGEITHAGLMGGGGFQNQDMPVTVTSSAVPGVVLSIICGIGENGENCTGLLAGS